MEKASLPFVKCNFKLCIIEDCLTRAASWNITKFLKSFYNHHSVFIGPICGMYFSWRWWWCTIKRYFGVWTSGFLIMCSLKCVLIVLQLHIMQTFQIINNPEIRVIALLIICSLKCVSIILLSRLLILVQLDWT